MYVDIDYSSIIPYSITIKNKSNKDKTVHLFSNEKHDEDIEISVNDFPFCSYESLKLELLVKPVSIGLTHLHSLNMYQIFKPIEVIRYSNNGIREIFIIRPTLDPLAEQSTVNFVKEKIILDSFTILKIELLPKTEFQLTFYPIKQISLSSFLNDKEIVLTKTQKIKNKIKSIVSLIKTKLKWKKN